MPWNYVEIYALKLGSCIKPVCIIEIEMLKIVDRDMHDFFFVMTSKFFGMVNILTNAH